MIAATRMRVLGPVVLALAIAVQGQQDANQCGEYESICVAQGGSFASSRVTVDGVTTGIISVSVAVYASADDCATKQNVMLETDYSGVWTDLGANITGRTWEIRVSPFAGYDVTATDPTMVADLNAKCKCGDTWVAGTMRTLLTCPAGTCIDTTWIGGTNSAAGSNTNGITFGAPFYGTTKLAGTALAMSQGDSSYAIGNGLDPATSPFLTLNQTGTCTPPTTSANFCGVWSMTCTHSNEHPNVNGMSAAFAYDGPASALFEAGVYDRVSTWFKDTSCQLPYLSISVPPGGGTFMQGGSSAAIPGGFKGIERPLYVNVTAMDQTALGELKNDCPCGDPDQWVLGSARQITSCPDICNAWWYDQVIPGDKVYSGMLRQDMDLYSELRISRRSGNEGDADQLPITKNSLPYLLIPNTCQYPQDANDDYCGVYETTCGAGLGGLFDYSDTLQFSGTAGNDSYATDAGMFQRQYNSYQAGQDCATASLQLSIAFKDGIWKDEGPSQMLVPGGRNVLITVPSVEVIPMTDDIAAQLNTACACNGTWTALEMRRLKQCTVDNCSDRSWLPSGEGALGEPGFGIVRLMDEGIRITSLQTNEQDGFSQFMDIDVMPAYKMVTCKETSPEYDYCGTWNLPCGSVSENSSIALDSKGTFRLYEDDTFNSLTQYYASGSGCQGEASPPILSIDVAGTISTDEVSNAVAFGHLVELTHMVATVVPLTDAATEFLTSKCPCKVGDSIWKTGKAITLKKACPKNTCADSSWSGYPIGQGRTAFGSIQRFSGFLRLTALATDRVTGATEKFTTSDRSYIMLDETGCQSNPASSKETALVVMSVFVLFIFAYFVFGMILNYRNTGSATMPHAGFWREFPGLVSNGCTFALCQCCGVRADSGARYNKANFNEAAAETETGYGAL